MISDCRYRAERMGQGLVADHLATAEHGRRKELVEHLRACVLCRRAVIEEEPTLVFSLLEADVLDEIQIADMQTAVRTLRRSRAIDLSEKTRIESGRKIAMVAASLLCALALLPLTGERTGEEAEEPSMELAAEQRSLARAGWPQWVEDRAEAPVIEELNRPEARVYQLTEEDLSVVMIVDETLDL